MESPDAPGVVEHFRLPFDWLVDAAGERAEHLEIKYQDPTHRGPGGGGNPGPGRFGYALGRWDDKVFLKIWEARLRMGRTGFIASLAAGLKHRPELSAELRTTNPLPANRNHPS